jgi:cyanophycinase
MENGTLALVGSGEYLLPMDPVDTFLIQRLPAAPRVVCLPTAAGEESAERIQYWSRLGVEHFTRLGVAVETVTVIDRQTADDETLAGRIREANFVYLSGGHPEYLYQTLAGSRAWEAITSVLHKNGVVAGCSAGAMIFGEKILGFRSMKLGTPGFGYLPGGVVMPHFDEIPVTLMTLALTVLPRSLTLVGIDGNTALVATPSGYGVVGQGSVTLWNKTGKKRLTEGDLPFKSLV